MKVYQINVVYGEKSTGRIVSDISVVLQKCGNECRAAFGRGEGDTEKAYKINSRIDVLAHAFMSRIFDNVGSYSKRATIKLIEDIEKFKPDIIHLHNIHGYYLNIKMLFDFLASYKKPVVWTLHDCWAFTGHCAYFDHVNCNKWELGCKKCPAKREYPTSFFIDNSKHNYKIKRDLFCSVYNLVLITPSMWLKNLVAKSFLKDKDCRIIYNGIDLEKFSYRKSDFRYENKIGDTKKMILGVASDWTPRKGLQDFLQIRKYLGDEYIIVLVGLNDKVLRNEKGFITIEKTNNAVQLAEIYSAADVFVNPTYEDNFPMVNIEALACGTPVITYDTGGSGECISVTTGRKVKKGNLNELIEAIKDITSQKKNVNECMSHAKQFSKELCYGNYVRLYEEILK